MALPGIVSNGFLAYRWKSAALLANVAQFYFRRISQYLQIQGRYEAE